MGKNLERVNHTFGPFYDSESRVLFLGSFPSVKSREALFYYGHPQNRFWKIMRAIYEDDFGDSIEEKSEFLHRHHIALYDVIDECDIVGSSDSSIRNVVPTDLDSILKKTKIEQIFVNGKTAEKYYKKYQEKATGRTAICLPSSSPANAAWSLEKLIAAWSYLVYPHFEYYVQQSERAQRFYADKNINDAYMVSGNGNYDVGLNDSSDTDDSECIVPKIRFKHLDQTYMVNACFTTRVGGVSSGDLSTLNLGFTRGDSQENIKENFKRALNSFDLLHDGNSLNRTVMTQQVHSDNIIRASKELTLDDDCTVKVEGVDGLYTDEKNLILSATFADCVPVYLVDPKKKRIALVHSGWKGTAAEIAAKGVAILENDRAFDEIDEKSALSKNAEHEKYCDIPDAENIIAEIGPSISGDHYEVTGEVIDAIAKNYSAEEHQDIFEKTDKTHYHLDMWAAIYYSLIHAGVLPEHIYFSGVCTYENASLLYSHRRSGGRRGNMNAFLELL